MSEKIWESENSTTLKIALRTKKRKYLATLFKQAEADAGSYDVREEELFDLLADPLERRTLSLDHSGEVGRFRAEMRAYLEQARQARAGRRGQKIELDEATEERLRSLGYLE